MGEAIVNRELADKIAPGAGSRLEHGRVLAHRAAQSAHRSDDHGPGRLTQAAERHRQRLRKALGVAVNELLTLPLKSTAAA